jgi:glycogen debranching enzyme
VTVTGGWKFGGPPARDGAVVTLVEGSSFCVSDTGGEILSGAPQGVFYLDTRIIAYWCMVLDGSEVEPLASFVRQPHHATFLGRGGPRGESLESTLLVQRERYVGGGMREDIIVRNVAGEPAAVTVEIMLDSDFADLFAVKEGRARPQGAREVRSAPGVVDIETTGLVARRGVRVRSEGAATATGRLIFHAVVPARDEWRATVEVLPTIDGVEVAPRFPLDQPIESSAPSVRMQEWLERTPVAWSADQGLTMTLTNSARDLGSLRIFDPTHPGEAAVAAGAPWFMALFGRDSLISAYMALPIDQQLALGTLRTLARYQGVQEDPVSEEQPGRILHEMRFGDEASLALGGGRAYYGTADATPLFVMLLGELWRWGIPAHDLQDLLPHADRALEWVEKYGDQDGDGFVEYQRMTDRGLRNQGWKDSWDGVNFADGRIAEPPIALCEVQAYTYAAYRARAELARHLGDEATASGCEERAAALKTAFNDAFWLPDRGWYAIGLDRDKRPIDALTSNVGHCLWAGIVDDDKAESLGVHLLSPEMFSGWGVRTLAASMGAYNPISYHNGSVWPHDNALIAAGLMRYGLVDQAQRVADGVLAAADSFDGRLPELFTGLDREAFPRPVEYPASCLPQAWASAAPIQLMRTLLRFDPALPDGLVRIDPALPQWIPELRVENAPLGSARLKLAVSGHHVELDGLPPDLRLVGPDRAAGDDWR